MTVIFCCYHGSQFKTKTLYLKTKKARLCSNAVILEKYLSKVKQHRLPDTLSKESLFKWLSVMIYEQLFASIVQLIMLSW